MDHDLGTAISAPHTREPVDEHIDQSPHSRARGTALVPRARLRRAGIALAATTALIASGTAVLTPATAAGVRLTDNPVGSAHYASVQWMAEQGITVGDTQGRFNKSARVTRGQTAAFLQRMVDAEHVVSSVSPFKDVAVGGSFYGPITWMATQGISKGYADGTFRTAQPITRGEMAALLYQAAAPDFTAPAASPFKDLKPGGAYYTAITWLESEDITHGRADGTFGTNTHITRAQMAAFLHALDPLLDPEPLQPEIPVEPERPQPTPTPSPTPTPTPTVTETPRPSWDTAPTVKSAAASSQTSYEERIDAYLDYYGCPDIEFEVVENFDQYGYGPTVGGLAWRAGGRPSWIQIRAGMSANNLHSITAHECMHARQHEATGYVLSRMEPMLDAWYDPAWTNRFGENINVIEQSAECALQTMAGFTSSNSGYHVSCDDRGLRAGRAIANGVNPNVVYAAAPAAP